MNRFMHNTFFPAHQHHHDWFRGGLRTTSVPSGREDNRFHMRGTKNVEMLDG